MNPDGRSGRDAFRCGCGARIRIAEHRTDARRCSWGECRTLATTKEPLRFCTEHEEQAATLLGHTAGAAKLKELEGMLSASRSTWTRAYGMSVAPLPRQGAHAPVVYFARRERLIKIGTSVRLRNRMAQLGAAALAAEPGDVVREGQLHRRFAHLLAVGREWFEPASELIAYINELRQADHLPPIES
ncbi:hypothetical protein ACFWHL_16185 [Streptomyces massasporeus]